MFPKMPDTLNMLTYLTQLPIAKFIWTPDEAQKAFNRMKAPIAHQDVLVHYPDQNEEWHIITDANDYQLGTVIMQKDVPISFYSCKLLNPVQCNYTTMERNFYPSLKLSKNSAPCYMDTKHFM